MPLDAELAGRQQAPTPPLQVTRAGVADFAAAIGATDRVHFDVRAARDAGHRDVVAPPTYPIVVAFAAMSVLLADPQVGAELRHVLHADQRLASVRPVRAGDVLTARLRVESVRHAAGATVVATSTEIATVEGEPVCTASATLMHRSGSDR